MSFIEDQRIAKDAWERYWEHHRRVMRGDHYADTMSYLGLIPSPIKLAADIVKLEAQLGTVLARVKELEAKLEETAGKVGRYDAWTPKDLTAPVSQDFIDKQHAEMREEANNRFRAFNEAAMHVDSEVTLPNPGEVHASTGAEYKMTPEGKRDLELCKMVAAVCTEANVAFRGIVFFEDGQEKFLEAGQNTARLMSKAEKDKEAEKDDPEGFPIFWTRPAFWGWIR